MPEDEEGLEEEIEEEVSEEEAEEKRKQWTARMYKIIFFIVCIALFIVVFSTVTNVYEESIPGVHQTCVEVVQKPELYNTTLTYSTFAAQENLQIFLGEDVEFVGQDIIDCGFAYTFNTTAGRKYLVCETGQVYTYGFECRDYTLGDKIVMAFEGLSNFFAIGR